MTRPGYIPKPISPESIPFGLSLADDRLSTAYRNVKDEMRDEANRISASFLRLWYKDMKYAQSATRTARAALLGRLQAMSQGDIFGNPEGLTKWFGERWVDVCHPPKSHKSAAYKKWRKCGRGEDDMRAYPKCRPLSKARKMSRKQMASACRRKREVERAETDTSAGRAPNMVDTFVNPSGRLTSEERRMLPDWAFGLPMQRKYPMYLIRRGSIVPSRSHAIDAKSRALEELDYGKINHAQYQMIVEKANEVLK